MHKQYIFAGKELQFLFQPAFTTSDASHRNARVGVVDALFTRFIGRFYSVFAKFHSRANPLFPSLRPPRTVFFLPFVSRFAICDF